MVVLGPNRYGKAEVRVVHVDRSSAEHRIRDWNVSMSLAGEMTAVHLSGANDSVLPTDTQKNTAYVLAQELGDVEPEVFALALARHFLTRGETSSRARIAVDSYGWSRLGPHSFAREAGEIRSTTVVLDEQEGLSVVCGLRDLVLMNTTDSEFWGFARDEFTTLPETTERILATEVTASWRYRPGDFDGVDWAAQYAGCRQRLLDAFVGTYSYSLQQTLFQMGEAVVEGEPRICEVRLALPNRHHILVDLSAFGRGNADEVYHAADRPYGLIEGHVLADDAPDAGLAWT
jgi:urate oxidase